MLSLLATPLLAALLAAASPSLPPPGHPGVFRRAARAEDGVHVALYLYVPEAPRSRAPLFVLLPDLGTNHIWFDQGQAGYARWLCDQGFPVVTLDWRGQGLSETPFPAPTIDDLLTRDLPVAANALGPDTPLILLGWGYSGALAYAAAAGPLGPRVLGVVALNAVVALDVPNGHVTKLLESRGGVNLGRRLGVKAPQRDETLFQLLWQHGSTLDDDSVVALRSHGLGSLSFAQVAQLKQWMKDGHTQLGGQPYPELVRQVKAPVLEIDAMLDNWTHPEFAQAVRDLLPLSQVTPYAVSRFAGFREDLGHVGLVQGEVARRELLPLVVQFGEKLRKAQP
jgi:alpha-beta hydrolase superfamily lysophospholipase